VGDFLVHYLDRENTERPYKLLLPFDLWKRQGLGWERMISAYYSDSRQTLEEIEVVFAGMNAIYGW
jgi:hypothetical protein